MTSNRNKIKWGIIIAAIGVICSGVVSVVNGGLSADYCNGVSISIENPEDEPYITNEDILGIITKNGTVELEGKPLKSLDLTEMEDRIKENKQVKSCEIHADLRGNLHIELEPYLPIARVLKNNSEDAYLADDGTLFPTSSHYTARVLLLSGNYFDNLIGIKSPKRKELLDFIKFIHSDEFWKAQFTQLTVTKEGMISITPLVGNYEIEFGMPDDREAKLKRLMIFYKQIAPTPEWSDFSVVSVAYRNQVVCR